MIARNQLLSSPPYAVDNALKGLGANLRTARLRRSLSVDEVASKIGTGRRAVMDAEHGKPSTGIAIYAALLWLFDLLAPFNELAAPSKDTEGQRLAMSREPHRAGRKSGLSNDF